MRRPTTGSNRVPARRKIGVSSVDFYRRVPKDLSEATTLGAIMSLTCIFIMSILFFSETWAFARSTIASTVAVDESIQRKIRLNFNITMLDLHCDYVSVDVLDSLGSNRQNVTKNIQKWQIDELGMRRIFSGMNREQREVRHDEHDQTLEEMHENGVHAIVIDSSNFGLFLKKSKLSFINFYAPWCMWCQRLHPTWEKFAELVEDEGVPVGVANVDCIANANLCREQKVTAYPTLRWYQDGVALPPDYKQDRTVAALVAYTKNMLKKNEKFKDWVKGGTKSDAKQFMGKPDHPGCQVSGYLMVNRVPGNFHIQAMSRNHNLNAAMTNLTHVVNHLSFGDISFGDNVLKSKKDRAINRFLKQVPDSYKQFSPIDGVVYSTQKIHEAHHHYIKVVSTHIVSEYGTRETYQMLEQSQIVYYEEMNVPEARFSYDISPMSVVVQKEGRKWYDYVTSLCAIIGGTFTTLGLIDASLYKVLKTKSL